MKNKELHFFSQETLNSMEMSEILGGSELVINNKCSNGSCYNSTCWNVDCSNNIWSNRECTQLDGSCVNPPIDAADCTCGNG
jgi:hypothetical protein